MTNRVQEQWKLLVFIDEGEKEPAVVGGVIDIGECIRGVDAVWRKRRCAARQHS